MKHQKSLKSRQVRNRSSFLALLGMATLIVTGCSDKTEDRDGEDITRIVLPTDVVLDLHCENVGVFPENCILEDPSNPFATVPITEFDVNNPDAPFNKLVLDAGLPSGPSGAKSRFYLWATALARFPSGENQYRTALALHELFDANSNVISEDELVRDQALKAYQSVLDNFFGSAEIRTCRVVDGCDPPVNFFTLLNEKVADNLYRTEATDFRRLVPGLPNQVIDLLLSWGYAYDPCTDLPECTNGVLSVITG